jgi:hypothetical protein
MQNVRAGRGERGSGLAQITAAGSEGRMNEPPAPVRGTGAALGCAAAGLLFASVGIGLAFIWAWTGAHCAPVPQCQRAGEARAAVDLLVLLGAAAGLGFLGRALARSVERALGAQRGAALAINIAMALLLLWAGYEGVMRGLPILDRVT